MKALLLSGGIESTCVAFWKRPDLCITVNYGQTCADTEVETARAISERLNIPHQIVVAVPATKYGLLGGQSTTDPHKPEFWPFRNQFLGTVAAMTFYETAHEIWFGSVKSDTKFLDGSISFFKKMDELVSYQEGGIRIKAPAITLSTEKLISISKTPRSILGATFSCHRGSIPCGDCPGCWKQQRLLYSERRTRGWHHPYEAEAKKTRPRK